MTKRPLLLAAVIFSAICFFICKFSPEIFMPAFAKASAGQITEGTALNISGEIYKTEEKTYSVYVFVKNAQISVDNKVWKAGNVFLTVDKEIYAGADLKYGNIIDCKCSFSELEQARNNGNYDEKAYYNSLGIFTKAKVRDIDLKDASVNWIPELSRLIRNKISEAFQSIVGDDESLGGIFMAITLGDKSSLSEGTKSLYSHSGIAHVLAISGLHISLIGMGIFSFLKKRAGPVAAGVISCLIMAFYCIMCGMSVSALRATVMFMIHMGAYFSGKTYDILSALSLAAILILISNPFFILNSGFILSFLAILSMGVTNRILTIYLKPEGGLAKALIPSISVTLTTLPAVSAVYGSVPTYGVLLNLIVIPLMSFVLAGGLLGGILGLASIWFGRMFIGLGAGCVYFINLCCYAYSFVYGNTLVTGSQGVVRVMVFYGLLSLFLILAKRKNTRQIDPKQKRRRYGALGLCIIMLVATTCVRPSFGRLEIIMFDVDQGDGILIKSPADTVFMIDGGSTGVNDLWKWRLEGALKYEGVGSIDYSIITHPDSDHISGILEVLTDKSSAIKIKNLLIPYVDGNENYEGLMETAEAAGVNVINIYSGMVIDDGSVKIECLHPEKGESFSEANDYSCVLCLSYGSYNALFTGDIGADVEKSLVSKGLLPKECQLLKVAHHGSKNSSCEEFLSALSPDLAVISAGIDNSYGHPAPEALERLTAAGADIYVTSGQGEIKITAYKNGESKIWTKL